MTDTTPPTDAPLPPVPADLDLRRLWWLKLDIGALLNSEFNIMTHSDTAWRAGVTLWLKAWHQVPAGGLPTDDRALCHLAGLGRDLRTWRRVKAEALHGFVLCADGRLYHTFLCKMALEAHAEMLRFEARRERDRARKSKGAGEINSDSGAATEADDGAGVDGEMIPTDGAGHSEGIPAENRGQDRREQESTPKSPQAWGFPESWRCGFQADPPASHTGRTGIVRHRRRQR